MEGNFSATVGRFAPSPSGRMHLGNVFSALVSYLSAKKAGGRWLLRIEDLDLQRSRPEFSDRILEDLEWLGLFWDGEVVYQSKRLEAYEEAFSMLSDAGLLYGCFCTRSDLHSASAPHSSDSVPVYSGKCRSLSSVERENLSKVRPPSWRFRVSGISEFFDSHYGRQKIDLEGDSGDFVVRRSDGNFAYQLSVVVDDAFQGVTEIVRGRDLILSAHRHIALCRALSLEIPNFSHVPLLVSKDGRRLSKRDLDADMGFLRSRFSAQEILGLLMNLAGFTQKKSLDLDEALEIFDWKRLPREDLPVSF